MTVMRNIEVPTGNILVVKGKRGNLECLSIGDYGKHANIKADFLGFDKRIERVTHQKLLPLSKKWVITVSSQYGCSMGCKFCDVPKVGKGMNAFFDDLYIQVEESLKLHPEVNFTERLNIHYARMGEPTWNYSVLEYTEALKDEKILSPFIGDSLIHPVVSTMLPKENIYLKGFLNDWMELKNNYYKGEAGLQFSINSTSDEERELMFNGKASSLNKIAEVGDSLPKPLGRKITLNFAVADYEIDAKKLRQLFDPEKFMVKLTSMHKTKMATENNIKTNGDYTTIYPYLKYEENLKEAGFDVLVFLASEEEDLGMITCGNAILSGNLPKVNYKEVL